MVDKSKLARLARQWKSQEIDKVIYGELEHYKPPHFTCWELHRAINQKKFDEPISYHSLNYHLRELEKKGYLKSEIVINENNRKERRFTYKKGKYDEIIIPKYLEPKHNKIGYIGKGDHRVAAHREYNKLKGLQYDESYYCKLCRHRHLSKKSKIWWDHKQHATKKKQHVKEFDRLYESNMSSITSVKKLASIKAMAETDKEIAKAYEDTQKGKLSISAAYKKVKEKYNI